MDCAEEVSLLRRQLSHVPGVRDLQFDIFQARMRVEYDAAHTDAASIQQAVRATGMRADPWQRAAPPLTFWQAHARTLLAALSGAALAAGMIGQFLTTGRLLEVLAHAHSEAHGPLPLPVLALYTLSVAAGLATCLPKAFASLRQFRPDMNALVVFSAAGAMALQEWTEAATLSFLFSLAGLLEAWSLAKAKDAITGLLQVTPSEATVVHHHSHGDHHGEHEHRTPVESVEPGAIVRVKPGERIPFDGLVERGSSYVDQALITGESVPIEKQPGASVYAGTINQNGMLEIKTTRRATDTVLARMVRMVEQSQSRRAPSEQFVERFSRVYTPAVFLLAFCVTVLPPLLQRGTWEHWFYQGMVILLISCPCALVISTPVSVVAALAAAARQGVLIKGGVFLEIAAKLKAIAFDKTGVLTTGEPEVQVVRPLHGENPRAIMERLAGLEISSGHPMGRAILRYAEAQGIQAPATLGFRAQQGRGAEAGQGSEVFWAGSSRLLRERGLLTPEAERELAALSDSKHTVVACGTPDRAWALVGMEDPPRAEAAAVIRELHQAGIARTAMLTGDNPVTARSVAQAVGLDEVHSEQLPEDKALRVREMISEFGPTAMVGDGVNDAQALSEASVGIGLGKQGADIAIETADIVLMSGDLRSLPFLVNHARRTVGVIQQNLAIALVTKAIFLAAAFAGMATLWMAVAADMGATFVVTFNGLRLLRSRAR